MTLNRGCIKVKLIYPCKKMLYLRTQGCLLQARQQQKPVFPRQMHFMERQGDRITTGHIRTIYFWGLRQPTFTVYYQF